MYSDVPATLLIPARRSDIEPRAMTKASVAAAAPGHYTEKMAERRSEFAISRLPLDELEPLIPRLTAIYFSAYRSLPEYAYEREDEVHGYLGWLAQGDPKGLFAGRHGDEIVAWMSVHGDWHGWRGDLNPAIGELQEIVIAQEWQKHGLGRRLVSLAIRHAARAGFEESALDNDARGQSVLLRPCLSAPCSASCDRQHLSRVAAGSATRPLLHHQPARAIRRDHEADKEEG